jgi:hypothetical protein
MPLPASGPGRCTARGTEVALPTAMTRTTIFVGSVLFAALLACGGSREVVVESPESPDEQRVLVPASRTVPVQTAPPPGTKIKRTTTQPDGTVIEQELEVDDD